jgi:hypothetical protein
MAASQVKIADPPNRFEKITTKTRLAKTHHQKIICLRYKKQLIGASPPHNSLISLKLADFWVKIDKAARNLSKH